MSVWTNNQSSFSKKKLEIYSFQDSANNPYITSSQQTRQIKYLYKYLSGLHCKTIVIEPYYFDTDYLSEFSEFYSTGAKGYSNVCKRMHFFSQEFTLDEFKSIISESDITLVSKFKDSYLGFSVVRPLPHAPIGNTVIRWFGDEEQQFTRIKALREYKIHLNGIELRVEGLAWQQQDSAVAACATIALWSAIHSAAFDESHYIPTTAEITKLAHKGESVGSRIFPSNGLSNIQLLEAIKELGLAPVMYWGSMSNGAFSPEQFSLLCATYLRSGFPIILGGFFDESPSDLHAVCITGFREPSTPELQGNKALLRSTNIETIYINDDNLGPNVRFAVTTESGTDKSGSPFPYVTIKAAAPKNGKYNGSDIEDPTNDYHKITPTRMRIAIPNEIKISVDHLLKVGFDLTALLCQMLNVFNLDANPSAALVDLHFEALCLKSTDYFGKILKRTLSDSTSPLLGDVRIRLTESAPPMSQFIGVIRIWLNGDPMVDVLYDTSDIDCNMIPFAHVCFSKIIDDVLTPIEKTYPLEYPKSFGEKITAY